MGTPAATREIYRRLCTGMLYAAGSPSAVIASGPNDPRSVLVPDWWKTAPIAANPAADFWVTAGITVNAKTPPGTMVNFRTYEFFGVRFEPDGLQRVADDAGVPVLISHAALLASAIKKPPSPQGPDWVSVQPAVPRPQQATRSIVEASAPQAGLNIKPNEEVSLDFLARTAPELVAAPPAKAARTPQRNPDRKAISGPPFAPDDKLTTWYEKYYAAHPDDVYRLVRPKADRHFQPKFKVGKNQLYYVMRAVQGGLKVGKR